MGFKHTLAPWKYTVRNANEIMTTFHGVTIGDVYLDITTANQKADAHLIAAAPELLEALIEMQRNGRKQGWDDKYESSMEKTSLAIAKAIGQQ